MAANLLLNPSFEVYNYSTLVPASWSSFQGTATGTITRAVSATGAVFEAKAWRIQYTGIATDTNKEFYQLQPSQSGSFAAGETAAASIYMSGAASGVSVNLRIWAYNVGGSVIGSASGSAVTLSSVPTRTTLTYTLPANTAYAALVPYVYAIDNGNTVDLQLDGAKLEKASSATAFWPVHNHGMMMGG